MASLTQWTWVWVNSRTWWWTGRTDVLQFMGSQRVGHNWATELNWTELNLQRQTLTTRHIHNWASLLLWPSCLILSGAVSNCPLLSLVVYQNLPTWVRREFIFQCHFFLPYHTKEQEELKSLLMRVKESVKAGLKLNIQKTKIIVSDPITSWQIEGKKWK